MKKLISLLLLTGLLLGLCVSFAACGGNDAASKIAFGEKYVLQNSDDKNRTAYIFYSDHTGRYERYYDYERASDISLADGFTLSGRVEFVWYAADDGGVHLFETETVYNDDHTKNHTIDLPKGALFFSEEFLFHVSDSQYGASNRYFIREGTSLDSLLKESAKDDQ